MENCSKLYGVVPPIVTPVDEHENINPAGLKDVIKYVMDGGVNGIFVNGSNGEFYGLDYENQKTAVETAVEFVNGKIPVYAGASAITTKESVRLAEMAESAGADALTVLTPMFIQPNEDELYNHFKKVAEKSRIPILLYNNPGKTSNNISPALLERLLELECIKGIKNTSMDFSLTMKYLEIAKKRSDFSVFGGIDYYIYATLVHGGTGCVAGTANVAPKLVVEIFNCYTNGDQKGALEAQQKLIPLRDAYSLGTFPVMMKVMLNLMGIDAGKTILPVSDVTDKVKAEAAKILTDLGLL